MTTTPAVVTSRHLFLYRLQETRGVAYADSCGKEGPLTCYNTGGGGGSTPPSGTTGTSPVGIYQVFGNINAYAQGLMSAAVCSQLVDQDYTIALRFNLSVSGTGTGIMVTVCGIGAATNNDDFLFYVGAGARALTTYQFQSTSSNTPIGCSNTLTSGTDHSLIITKHALGSNQFQYTCYLDGAQFNQQTVTGHTVTPVPTADYLTVNGYIHAGGPGASNGSSGDIWSVAELQLLNYCASSTEAAQIHAGPAAPSAPSPTAVAHSGYVKLSWSAPTTHMADIASYTVTTSPATVTTTLGPSETGVTLDGLTNGQAYTFSVVANSVAGNSTAGTASATPFDVPGAPTGLTAPVTGTSVVIGWTAPASNGGSALTGYTVTVGGTPHSVSSGTTTLSLSGLTPNTTYAVTVIANNAAGSGAALVGSFNIPGSPPSVAVVSPAAGSGVTRSTPLVLDITDIQTLEREVLLVSQGDLSRAELAYDGTRFTLPYSVGSTVSNVSGGRRFSLVRTGGWTGNPSVEVIAYDISGDEA